MALFGFFKNPISGLFRERQIYHRSDGVVHFIKMSTHAQIILALGILAFIAWVAYTSVTFLFQEHIIRRKDADMRETQTLYASRLRESNKARDDMAVYNTFLTEQYDIALADINDRQQTLERVIGGLRNVDQDKEAIDAKLEQAKGPGGSGIARTNRIMMDSAARDPTPRESRLDPYEKAIPALYGLDENFHQQAASDDPIERSRNRNARNYLEQIKLLFRAHDRVQLQITELNAVIDLLGIDFESERKNDYGRLSLPMGGPQLSIEQERVHNFLFYRLAERTEEKIEQLRALTERLLFLPLGSPIIGKRHQTSGFGRRPDPFTKRMSMHHGLDYVARYGMPIRSTASGVVIQAGYRGTYGNVVEIDHGNGLHTRYAHLSRIKVKKMEHVYMGDVVGIMGSTGRSTGRHLHYEVRYRGKALDPEHFLKAGRYVYER